MHTSFVWVFMRLIWCFGIKIHTLSKVKYFFFFLHKLAPVKIDGKTSLAAYCPLILQFSSFCLRRRRLCICLKCLTRNVRRVLRGSRNDLGSIICYTLGVGIQTWLKFITCSIFTKLVGMMHLKKTC